MKKYKSPFLVPGKFPFGTCTVPDGKRGPWTIDTFTLTHDDVVMHNMRDARDTGGFGFLTPGTFKRLMHDKRGVIMSNTRMEVRSNIEAFWAATGRVLINGLGMGMLLEGILSKSDVSYVRVVEIDPDVIALVGPHYTRDKRVEIVQADAYTYRPAKGEVFDYVWHDIWDDVSADNLPRMAKLGRIYNKRIAKASGVWSRDFVRYQNRRESRSTPWF